MRLQKRRIVLLLTLTLTILISAGLAAAVGPAAIEIAAGSDESGQLAYLPLISRKQEGGGDWPMAGANPQRTSWKSGIIKPSGYGVEWYRPIEGYIQQHVQLVTARDKVFVATSRGLYALSVSNGNEVWRFDTELPVGHSPTVVGNTVYFGSFDNHLYALDSETGKPKWKFAANSGFSTSPLVVNGIVYAGNRDGYFYAVNASDGILAWRFPESGQDPLAGPVLYSAAYANGKVYFAANDQYAYALDADTGRQVWKSDRLPGEGFHAFWPVVYKDYVVFSGSDPYKPLSQHVPGSESIDAVSSIDYPSKDDLTNHYQKYDVFGINASEDSIIGPTFTADDEWMWPNGSAVIDAVKITQYMEDDGTVDFNKHSNKPWRRVVFVLNQADGREYTFDSDSDNNTEFAPFSIVGTKTGPQHPPILLPDKYGNPGQLLTRFNLYQRGTWIPSKAMMTWYPRADQHLQLLLDSDTSTFAIDEPTIISGVGNIILTNLCCDREAYWHNVDTGQWGGFWSYNLNTRLPGYDQMWFGNSLQSYYPKRAGGYGSPNGVYHSHGLQNPFVPYGKRLFTHRSNAVIALGPNSPRGERSLLTYDANHTDRVDFTEEDVRKRLDDEVQKIIDAGFLQTGYYSFGDHQPGELNAYYEDPGETLYTLSLAYPHVSGNLKPQLKSYLADYFQYYFAGDIYASTGWSDNTPRGPLQPREHAPLAPEVRAHAQQFGKSTYGICCFSSWDYNPFNTYAMWKYAELVLNDAGDPNRAAKILEVYQKSHERLDFSPPDDGTLAEHRWQYNAFFAGYSGFLKLQQLADKDGVDTSLRNQAQKQLNNLSDGSVDFIKDNPWYHLLVGSDKGKTGHNEKSIYRNFFYITPELGDFLENESAALEALDEYQDVAPFWFAARHEAYPEEGIMHNLYERPALFQAKAWLADEPFEELAKYIDVPAFKVGDLYYIQNLAVALGAPSGPN